MAVSPKAKRFRLLPRRNPRDSTFLSIKFRGGPECWYEVTARGVTVRYPGVVCLHDVMEEINMGRDLPYRE